MAIPCVRKGLNTDEQQFSFCFFRNVLFRPLQSSGWRATKDFSTWRSRLCRLCTHRWEEAAHTKVTTLPLSCTQHQNKTRGCSAVAVSFCIPLLFHPHVSNWQITCCVLIGQPPGAILHTLPCSGGGSYVPVACKRGENSREQAGARAEAEHHLPVLCQLRASGPLSPSGAG